MAVSRHAPYRATALTVHFRIQVELGATGGDNAVAAGVGRCDARDGRRPFGRRSRSVGQLCDN